jgi:CMP-N,N'-diacetyllegionaminic acid synthase
MTKAIYAVIPARQGSKGVPNKNIRLLGGHPLIAYSIALARMTPEISRVIVSTDSSEYARIAKKYGAETPFLRPTSISEDRSTDLDFVNHCLKWFLQNENQMPDLLVHLRPTTPLRSPDIISKAIAHFVKMPEATSLRSGHISPESPLKWFKKNQRGYFTTLSDEQDLEDLNRARQEFQDIYIPDGYIDVLSPAFILKEEKLHGARVLAFESPFCIEIDTQDEFDYLEYWLLKNQSPLKTYLDALKHD